MKIKSAYLIGKHEYTYRVGEKALITGVVFATPNNLSPRLCYSVLYEDGQHDIVPVSSIENGEYKTFYI